MSITATEWAALLPALCVMLGGLFAVGIDVFLPRPTSRWPLSLVSLAGLAFGGALLGRHLLSGVAPVVAFGGSLVLDDMAAFVSLAIIAATALLLLASDVDVRRRHIGFGEYYGLVMIATAAMILLVASNDLMMIFVNIEILSIALYVLTGITRKNPRSNEAAVKYLVTGAFASCFLLMGMAMLYGATGTFGLPAIGAVLAGTSVSPLLPVGLGLLIVGFGFKIGAAPFHMWVPDVYEGAPTSTTAFMSVTVKAAGVATLIRVLLTAAPSHSELWADLIWWMAVATMIVGNLLAAQQTSVKRMLAFSSVAHTGYALVAIATMRATDGSFSSAGASSALFYVLTYTFMTLGAFLFLAYIGHEAKSRDGGVVEWQDAEQLDDFAGLAERRPWAAAGMALFLVSLGGIPPTAGFLGKFYLLSFAVSQDHIALAVITVMASLVSMYYYLRVAVYMYMKEPVSTDELPDRTIGFVIGLAAVGTLVLGVLPSAFLDVAVRSITDLHG